MIFQILKTNLFKTLSIFILLISLFLFKLYLNNFLMAENGDTYDFFKISYELKQGNFLYESKRLPLYSALLVPFNPDDFVFYGRIINNLLYFAAVILFYKLISLKFSLNLLEKIFLTLIFAFNFIVFDNSFYILSDTLLLLLVVLFFYLYEKNSNWFLLSLVGSLAVYTRFEGLILLTSLYVYLIFKKDYSKFLKTLFISVLLLIPLYFKFYFSLKTGTSYFNDEVGFTLKYENILKALGSVAFATGGFWLISLFLLKLKKSEFSLNLVKLFKNYFSNLYLMSFTLFALLLVLWGFFIRLYSPLVFFGIIYFIYLYKNIKNYSNYYLLLVIPFSFYLINVQILDHFDLGYFKLSKIISIIMSFLVVLVIISKRIALNTKLIISSLLVVILNLSIFVEKFVHSREKYYSLVQASEYVIKNNLKNVAYFDESGVQGWYLKDFNNEFQYYERDIALKEWLEDNKIEYIMVTEEMGYQISQIVELRSEIKRLYEVKSFKSSYFGGKTVIYKLNAHKID